MKSLFLFILILLNSIFYGQDTINYKYSINGKDSCKCDYTIIIDNPVNPDIVILMGYKDTIRLIVFADTNSINEGYVKLNVLGYDEFKSIELGYYSAILTYKRKFLWFKVENKVILSQKDPSIPLHSKISPNRQLLLKFEWENYVSN